MEKIIIWGTGTVANIFVNRCSICLRYEVVSFVDNNMEKNTFCGYPVIHPKDIRGLSFDYIFIATVYYDEIMEQLNQEYPELIKKTLTPQDVYKLLITEHYKDTNDNEIKELLKYIEKNDLQMFPYSFVSKYSNMSIDVLLDETCGLFYVMHSDKKLYFARYLNSVEKVKSYYISLLIEKDEESPHCYEKEEIVVKKDDVLVDVGAAEGIFTLDNVDKISKAYLFEANEDWIEALYKTFEAYREKTKIIKGYVSDEDMGMMCTIDASVEEPIDFLKMDIEGAEWNALNGAEKTILTSNNIRCSICVYHRIFDGELIKSKLNEYGIKSDYSDGYAWFNPLKGEYRDSSPAYFTRCLLRGRK